MILKTILIMTKSLTYIKIIIKSFHMFQLVKKIKIYTQMTKMALKVKKDLGILKLTTMIKKCLKLILKEKYLKKF